MAAASAIADDPAPGSAGWRALRTFWLLVLLILAAGTATLAWLGPPAPRLAAEAEPPAFTPLPDPPSPSPAGSAPAAAPAPPPPDPALAAVPQVRPFAAIAPPPPDPALAAVPQVRPFAAIAPPLGIEPAPPPPPAAAASVPPAITAALPPPATPAAAPPGAERGIGPVDPAMLENGPYGPLPRIGPNGRTAIRAYARPFDRADPRPRVGLILGGLGLNARLTEEAIARLPGGVTLAFNPYAPSLAQQLDRARSKGMEVLISLPLEPTNYPLDTPGDRGLLTGLPATENRDRLDWVLSRFTGYVGAIGALGGMLGERFAQMSERIGPVQDTLSQRGLLYIDPRPGARGPDRAWGRAVDSVVDRPATRGEIDLKLAGLERMALDRTNAAPGSALGYAGDASPMLLDRLVAWSAGIEGRGIVLAPASALIRRPEASAAR